jgi:hypothetical protein
MSVVGSDFNYCSQEIFTSVCLLCAEYCLSRMDTVVTKADRSLCTIGGKGLLDKSA